MNKLQLLATTTLLVAGSLIFWAPGCTDSCTDLSEQCGRCADEDYAASCRQTVNQANQDLCQLEMATFQQYCTLDLEAAGTTGTGSVGPNGCTRGKTLCGGSCVDLSSNPAFCGSCVNDCGSQVCSLGSCADACQAPLTNCDGACLDLLANPDSCGGCLNTQDGAVCGDDRICADGRCVVGPCDPQGARPTECNGGCVNLAEDPLNCGECGNSCSAGQVCSGGQCASECGSGLTQCCGQCVDTGSDPDHCGACAVGCPEVAGGGVPFSEPCAGGTPVCLNGGCAEDCGSFSNCGNACVDTNGDPANCGACGNVCGSGEVCSDGSCTADGCAPGTTACDGACIDVLTDVANCGACGTDCREIEGVDPPFTVCNNGSCAASCAPLATCDFNGLDICVNTTQNPSHCGACGNACGQGQVCAAGTCLDACPTGLTDCDGACVNIDTDGNHCGSCGNSCNDANVCTFDTCKPASGQTPAQCSNVSGAVVCDDKQLCTKDECDEVKGCTSTRYDATPELAAEYQGICAALANVPDPSAVCFYCQNWPASDDGDPEFCATGVPAVDGFDCTDDSSCFGQNVVADIPNVAPPRAVEAVGVCKADTCASICGPVHTPDADPATFDSKGCVLNNTICSKSCQENNCVGNDGINATTDSLQCFTNHGLCTSLHTKCFTECDPDSAQANATTGCVPSNDFCANANLFIVPGCSTVCTGGNFVGDVDNTGCLPDNANCDAGEFCRYRADVQLNDPGLLTEWSNSTPVGCVSQPN